MVGTPAFDTLLDLCRHQHRRIVLATFAEEKRRLTVNDLTKSVLKYNHQMPVTEVSGEVLEEVEQTLHHLHLPKLAAAGVVEYDPDRGLVEPTEQFDQLQPSLSTILDADPTLEEPLEL